MHNTSYERFFSFITTAVIFRNDSGILKFRSLDLSALSKPESPSDAFRFRKLSIKIREKATKKQLTNRATKTISQQQSTTTIGENRTAIQSLFK